MSNKNWGQERKRRKEVHNRIDAVVLLRAKVNLEQNTQEKLLWRLLKATKHVPRLEERDMTDEKYMH